MRRTTKQVAPTRRAKMHRRWPQGSEMEVSDVSRGDDERVWTHLATSESALDRLRSVTLPVGMGLDVRLPLA
jgi:hypothetical protein